MPKGPETSAAAPVVAATSSAAKGGSGTACATPCWWSRNAFSVLAGVLQLAILILFGANKIEYSEGALAKNAGAGAADASVGLMYPFWTDVHAMIFIGFGFLMTFLARYSWTGVGYNFIVAALVRDAAGGRRRRGSPGVGARGRRVVRDARSSRTAFRARARASRTGAAPPAPRAPRQRRGMCSATDSVLSSHASAERAMGAACVRLLAQGLPGRVGPPARPQHARARERRLRHGVGADHARRRPRSRLDGRDGRHHVLRGHPLLPQRVPRRQRPQGRRHWRVRSPAPRLREANTRIALRSGARPASTRGS